MNPRGKPAFETADHWFYELYLGLAEFQPNELTEGNHEALEIVPLENDNHPLWSLAIAIGDGRKGAQKRLPPYTFEELFLLHAVQLGKMLPAGQLSEIVLNPVGSHLLDSGKNKRSDAKNVQSWMKCGCRQQHWKSSKSYN